MFVSIRHKITAIFVLLLVAATLSYFALARRLFNSDKTVYIFDAVASLTETLAAETEANITNIIRLLRIVAVIASPKTKAKVGAPETKLIKELLVDEVVLKGAAVVEIDRKMSVKKVFQTVHPNEQISQDEILDLLVRPLPTGVDLWAGYPHFSAAVSKSGMPLLMMTFGTVKGGEVNEAVVAVIDHSSRLRLFERSKLYSSFLMDSKGMVILHSDIEKIGSSLLQERPKIVDATRSPGIKGAFEDEGNDRGPNVVAYRKIPTLGLITIAEIPVELAFLASLKLLERTAFIGVLVICIGIALSVILTRKITTSLHRLTLATKRIGEGDFSIEVPKGANDEVAVLTTNFNLMQRKINSLLQETAVKARMERELEVARYVQESFFPKGDFSIGDYHVSGFHKPASECGGDFWGSILRNGRLLVFIGDATGHGVPAALMTAVIHSCTTTISQIAKLFADWDMCPAKILETMNVAVWRAAQGKVKMTMFCLEVEIKSGFIRYANASHESPFILRAKAGEKAPDIPIDCFDGQPSPCLGDDVKAGFAQYSHQLECDDSVVLYTDGLTESRNAERQEYGERRLLKLLHGIEGMQPRAIKDHIIAHNETFIGSHGREDDLTLVVIKRQRSELLSAQIPAAS